MNPCTRLGRWSVLAALVVATIGSLVPAHAAEKDVDVVAELQALKAEVARLRAENGDSWLNQRRAEEVKSLVREVLSDADTRASLAGEGMTAGWKKGFFLSDPEGKFLLEIGGQLQFRYIANFNNHTDGPGGEGDDDEDEGFQVRRTKVAFEGHVEWGRKWDYKIVLAGDRESSSVGIEDFVIGTKIADGLKIKFGKFKLPFLREELTSSKRQLAVDRGVTTEFFTLDRSEQVQIQYQPMDAVKLMLAFSDGADEEFSTIGADDVEFAVTARADIKLAGDWGQMKDYNAWEGEPFGAFIGAALHYQMGDDENNDIGSNDGDADYFAWTVDGSVETNGLSVDIAVMGGHINVDDDNGFGFGDDGQSPFFDRDFYGIKAQGGYFVIPKRLQPFVRFEWMTEDTDDGSSSDDDDDALFLTAGANSYWNKAKAKATVDVVWWIDGDGLSSNPFGNGATSDGLGFSSGDDPHSDGNLILRAQFQLVF